MSRAAQLREIEAIVADNARLLGEPVRLAVRFTAKPGWPGWVRVYDVKLDGKINRKAYREYLGIPAALDAAREANRRAQEWRRLVDSGVPKDAAYLTVVPRSDR